MVFLAQLAEGWSARQRVLTLLPPSSTYRKAGRNHLNKEITPLLSPPHWDRRAIQSNYINLGHAALLRRCELPPIKEIAELTQGAL